MIHFHRYKKDLRIDIIQEIIVADYTETCRCGKRKLHLMNSKRVPQLRLAAPKACGVAEK